MTCKWIKLLGLLLFWPGFSCLLAQNCDCKTTGNCPVWLQDYGTFKGILDVVVNGPNDLGKCPLTKVCFTISHTWIGDLSVALTSPDGTNYLLMADADNTFGGCGNNSDNVEVCIELGTHRPLMNNKEYECNSGPCSAGTCCIVGNWTVPCGGVTDSVSFAKQAPNCDLNDFNKPGSPANGTWTLTVNDMCVEDFGSLDNFSLYFGCGTVVCNVCEANGGSLDSTAIIACSGDFSLNLNVSPIYKNSSLKPDTAHYDYLYAVTSNGKILDFLSKPDLNNMPAGNYRIYGISLLKQATTVVSSLKGNPIDTIRALLSSKSAPFCGDISSNYIPISILPLPALSIIDTALCEGTCLVIGGTKICDSGQIKLKSSQGCDSIIQVKINRLRPVRDTLIVSICKDSCTVVAGKNYCLPGPYTIILRAANGCDSIVYLVLREVKTNSIITPSNPPLLTCKNPAIVLSGASSTPANALFSWMGPDGFSAATQEIQVTTPGEYKLIVRDPESGFTCGSKASVEVKADLSKPELSIVSDSVEICYGSSFDLATLNIKDLNSTNPVISFHSDTPANSANKLLTTQIQPFTTTRYFVLATGTYCQDEKSILMKVHPEIVSDFKVENAVCQDSATFVVFTGIAGNTANFNWNFDGADVSPGTGRGPHRLTWHEQPGKKKISLTISENGCLSSSISKEVEVYPRPKIPVVSCKPAQDSVLFTWQSDIGMTYKVNVLLGPSGYFLSESSYSIPGLKPDTKVVMELETNHNAYCAPLLTTASCASLDCSGLNVELNQPEVICFDIAAEPLRIQSKVSGNSNSGKGIWKGTGIIDSISGFFDIKAAGPGVHHVQYIYTDKVCVVQKSLAIKIAKPPIADAGTPKSIGCLDDESVFVLGGKSATGFQYTYLWQSGKGKFPGDSTQATPKVGKPGVYTLMLTDTLTGCTASSTTTITDNRSWPIPLLDLKPVSCLGQEDGSIEIRAVSGGLKPFLYSLNNAPFSSNAAFRELKPGYYKVAILDAAGCEGDTLVEIPEGNVLKAEILTHMNQSRELILGDSVMLEAFSSFPTANLDKITWEPKNLVSCDSCPVTFARPVETTTFRLTLQKSGCRDDDSKIIVVNKNYVLYAPTAFSPNKDGVNESFTLFTGIQVASIRNFSIYNRWGELVFHKNDLPLNSQKDGWNGSFKGQNPLPGTYSWGAEIEFVDGRRQPVTGTFSLVK